MPIPRLSDTPRQAYERSLIDTGLASRALGAQWLTKAARALTSPLDLTAPYTESGWLHAEESQASAWRLPVERDQRLILTLSGTLAEQGALFLEILSLDDQGTPTIVTAMPRDATRLEHTITESGEVIVRLQPELLVSGGYSLDIQLAAVLKFPVQGKDSRAVGSTFGATRDAGRRRHEGIDIFAPRGTPVIAATAGTIRSTRTTPRGGLNVWQRTDRGYSLYYAHLDGFGVAAGDQVLAGDVIGFVGNTGNAITTPPHLHFGVYRRGSGAIDPYPLTFTPKPPETIENAAITGEHQWQRVIAERLNLRQSASTESNILVALSRGELVATLAASGNWYRVRSAADLEGYIYADYLEPTGAVSAGTHQVRSPVNPLPVGDRSL